MHQLTVWVRRSAILPEWVGEKKAKGEMVSPPHEAMFFGTKAIAFRVDGVQSQQFGPDGSLWVGWPGLVPTVAFLPHDALAYEVTSPGIVFSPKFEKPRANNHGRRKRRPDDDYDY